jgi:hypothetical protein
MAGYSQAQLDTLAQQQGFKNYAQWQAWNARTRNVVLQQPRVAGRDMNSNAELGRAAPQNWLQQLLGAVHPLNYVNSKLKGALGD